ncbi:hypothetical protein EJB05_47082, partial [Eragrostis curvula]
MGSLVPRLVLSLSINNSTSRRNLGYLTAGTGNPIDDCWRWDPDWHNHRQRLADCGIGFGRNAIGGRDGKIYVVTDPSDDDAVNPRKGTLRWAVIQEEPLWIIFKRDMGREQLGDRASQGVARPIASCNGSSHAFWTWSYISVNGNR